MTPSLPKEHNRGHYMVMGKVDSSHKGDYRVTVLSSELILRMVWGLEVLSGFVLGLAPA